MSQPQITRRGFLKAAAIATGAAIIGTSNLACLKKQLYGTPIYRLTGDNLSDSVAEYFNKNELVYGYDEPLAQALNFFRSKEKGKPISKKLSIEFKGSLGGANGSAGARVGIDGLTLRYYDGVQVKDGRKAIDTLGTSFHEVSHLEEHTDEVFAVFDSYKTLVKSYTHDKQFALSTDYALLKHAMDKKSFQIPLQILNKKAPQNAYSSTYFATLFALNDSNGDISEAEQRLKQDLPFYFNRIQDFLKFSASQPDVEDVTVHYPDYDITANGETLLTVPATTRQETFQHGRLSVVELFNVVAYQVVNYLLNSSGENTPEKAKELRSKLCWYRAAYPHTYGESSDESNIEVIVKEPVLDPFSNTFYKTDFAEQHPFIIVPAGYDHQIPKGE